MDTLLTFLFEGLPVRGQLLRLEGAWQQALARRASASDGGHVWPEPVRALLGEMAAAGLLMQAALKFNGAVVLQIQGDGPVRLAVCETQPELSFRVTAKLDGEVDPLQVRARGLAALVNVAGHGRCSITLDPKDRLPGQQPYQGIVSLHGARGQPLAALDEVLGHYMRQSEQLDTVLLLAADDRVAAGLLLQRLPGEGGAAGLGVDAPAAGESSLGQDEHFNRLAMLAGTLGREELLAEAPETLLRRLFWEETVRLFEPRALSFACRCSRERVSSMLRSLGEAEVRSIVAERGEVEVGCDFCGQVQRFDAVDVEQLFHPDAAGGGAADAAARH